VTSSGRDVDLDADALEADLRTALTDGALEVHYQPTVDAVESQVLGFEALVRWQHPVHGPVSPARFVAVAERSDLILDLGSYVLGQACDEGVRLRRDLPDRRLTISVNVSARQLVHRRIVDDVRAVLEATGLDADLLSLELTESVLMADLDEAAQRLQELRELGVLIAIDDFGTGFSSLAHLKRFQADSLKIDRAFIDGLGRDNRDTEIVRAIIGIGQSLHMELIAEGVEHAEQLELLLELGCRRMQGYFWSAPVRSGRLLDTIERIARLGGASTTGSASVDAAPGESPARDAAVQALLLLDHELRNPLTVIGGYLEALEDLEQGPQGKVAVAAMRRALATMTRTLESFASVHALEGGGRPLHTRAIDVAALVGAIVEELAPVVHDKHIEVSVRSADGAASGEAFLAEADEHATRLIVVNLLTNADKYAPPGTRVHVVVTSDALPSGPPGVCVAVADEGPGIAAADADRVFEKFERASTSAKGYGLGLYLSRRLARQQGGDLVYRPAAGGGAEFLLTLPAVAS
jgi:EAL domain-containing protein (putative c-di-GMP-specific phosphodiesterase class I)/two-component sensor histidine kinase